MEWESLNNLDLGGHVKWEVQVAMAHHILHISSHATFSVIPDYQRLGPNKGLEVSRLKLDLTEWHAGSIHLLTVEFSEFDVTGN